MQSLHHVGDTIYNILKMEEMRTEIRDTKSHETDGNALTGVEKASNQKNRTTKAEKFSR